MAGEYLGSVYGKIELKDETQTGIQSASKNVTQYENTLNGKLKSLGKGFTDAGKKLTVGLSVPLTIFGGAALNAAASFDEIFRGISAIARASGSSEDDINQLRDAIMEFGQRGVFSINEVAQAVDDMVKDGLDPAAISASQLPAVYDLAAASGEDLASSQIALSDAMQSFGASTDEAQKYADTFANFLNATPGDLYDFQEALQPIGPIAAANGISLDELGGALAILANNGIRGSEAGNGLKRVLLNLQSPTGAAADAIEDLGIQVYDAEGNMRPLVDILGQLEDSLSGATQEEKNFALEAIGGAYGVTALNTLLNEGTISLADYTEAMKESGSASQIAADRQEGLSATLKELKAKFQTIMITIGEAIAPVVEQLAEKLVPAIEKAVKWFNQLSPGVKQAIVIFGGLLIVLGPLLMIVGGLITAITTIGGALAAISGPVWIVIGVIAALIAIIGVIKLKFDELKQKWEEFKKSPAGKETINFLQKLKETYESLKETATTVFEKVREVINKVVEVVKSILVPIFEKIKPILASAWEKFMKILQKIMPVLKILGIALLVIVGVIVALAAIIIGVIVVAIAVVILIIAKLIEIIMIVVNAIIDFVISAIEWFKQLPERIGEFITQAIEWFKSLPERVREFISNLIENIVYWIGYLSVWLPAKVQAFINAAIAWFKALPGRVATFMVNLWNTVVTWFTTTKDNAIQKAKELVEKVVEWFKGLPEKVKNGIKDLWSKMKEKWNEAKDKLKEFIDDWIGNIKDWGKNLVNGFVDGIKSGLHKIKEAFVKGQEDAKASIEGGSPPKEGPWKNIDVWGYNIGTAWAEGVKSGMAGVFIAPPELPVASAGLGEGDVRLGGGKSVVVQQDIHDNVIEKDTIETLKDELVDGVMNAIGQRYGMTKEDQYFNYK